MGRMLQGLAVLGLTLLSGCGICGCLSEGPEYPAGQNFTYNGNFWRVADVRGEGRLEIVAVGPRLAGLGTEAASRHAVGAMPEAEYRAAVMGWFATGGRFCTPDAGVPNDDQTGYDYAYRCWLPA